MYYFYYLLFCVFFIAFIEFSFNFQYLNSEPALVRDFTKVGIYKLKLFILRHVWYLHIRHHFLEYKHSSSMLALAQRKLPAITLLLKNNKRIQLGKASLNLIDLFLKWGGGLNTLHASNHAWKAESPPPSSRTSLYYLQQGQKCYCIYIHITGCFSAICKSETEKETLHRGL